jgi:hypothetical protein
MIRPGDKIIIKMMGRKNSGANNQTFLVKIRG